MSGGLRVLVVDELPEAAAIEAYLDRRDDMETVVAATRDDAMGRLGDQHVDCVVADPDSVRDPVTFVRDIQESASGAPVIWVTNSDPGELDEATRSAAQTIVEKGGRTDEWPFLVEKIQGVVQTLAADRAREEIYRSLVETAADGLYRLDANGDVTYLNDAFAEMLGYDRGELHGVHASTVMREGELERGQQVVQELMAAEDRETEIMEMDMMTKGGEPLTVSVHFAVLTTDDGTYEGLVGVVRDVTERKHRERELADLRRRYELVVQASLDAFWDWRPHSDEVARSEEFLSEFGYDPEEVGAGMEWWEERIHPDDRTRVLEAMETALENPDTTYDESYRFRQKDGSYGHIRSRGYVVYDEEGTPVRMVGAHIDITELREHEAELDRVARRFEGIFENPLTLIGLLRPDGRLIEANQTALDLVETTMDEVRDTPFWETPWWSHTPEVQDSVKRWITQAAEGDHVRFEEEHPTAEGGPVTIDGVIHPVHDEDNAVAELVAVGRDVSTRKRRERELERQNERLEEFASVLSHDLRNPLNVAMGNLDLARETGDAANLEAAEDALDRMATLIDDLLTLARHGEEVRSVEQVDLAEVVQRCWRTVETAEAGIVRETDRTVRADPSRLKQLLENLIRNAVEHGGGDVTVRIGDLDDGFYVADDGPGIEEDRHERIFEAGYSTSTAGTGFGLRIVEQIATAHGWEVRVTESAQGGAQFEFRGVDRVD